MTTEVILGEAKATARELSYALRTVKPLASKYISNNLHIGREQGEVYLEASDGLNSARVFLEATSEGDLGAAINLQALERILKAVGAKAELQLLGAEGELRIVAGPREFTIAATPRTDFPSPDYDYTEPLLHGEKRFIDVVKRAITHASQDDTRPVLCGVHFEREQEGSFVVATDSYRLFIGQLPVNLLPDTSLTAPGRELGNALGTVGTGEGVNIAHVGQQVIVDTGYTEWSLREVEGQYPKWRQLVPEDFAGTALLAHDALYETVKAIGSMATGNAPIVLDAEQADRLEISVAKADEGEAHGSVQWKSAAKTAEARAKIGVNPDFFAQALKALPGEKVMLQWTSPLRPLLLTGQTGDRVLLMPVRLQV